MPEKVILALALSVALHVCWNLIARRAEPDSHFLWWAILGHLLAIGPWSIIHLVRVADWHGPLVLWLALSAVALCAYFLALGQAYRLAPVNFVYPLARSLPVLLVGVFALPLFGEAPGLVGWIGIGLTAGGVALLAMTSEHRNARGALPWTGLAVLGTTVYSLSDRAAVAALPDLVSQLGYVSVAYAAVFAALTVRNRQRFRRWTPPLAPPFAVGMAGALCIGTSYALVIFSMRYIPAAYAVAFTNVGIIVAAAISFVWERERECLVPRARAIALTVAGLSLLVFGRQ